MKSNFPESPVPVPLEPVKYCLYARKSSEEDERQALSIDSQIKEMMEMAARDAINVVEIRKESHSAKASGMRPVFNELITDIRSTKFTGILTWAPDRLSRNAGDLGSLVDLMDQKLLREIRTYSQRFSDSPNEKFLLMILCSQAKLENDNRGINVKRGLRASLERGLWPAVAPTGYLNEKRTDRRGYILLDRERAPVIKLMFEKVANEGWSGRDLHAWLKDEVGFTTRFGKPLSLSNIYTLVKNPFYYGVVEYPVGSGKWYQCKHEPITTKEVFDKVQGRLSRDGIVRIMNKDFAFTRLMTCGMCGSGISAQEKHKKLKNGSTNIYIYYGCSRARDLHCKNVYTREEEIIVQLGKIIDKLDINELGMKAKLEDEVRRFRFFQDQVLGDKKTQDEDVAEVNIRAYAKYLLKQGSIQDKRELVGCLKSRLLLKDRRLSLEKVIP